MAPGVCLEEKGSHCVCLTSACSLGSRCICSMIEGSSSQATETDTSFVLILCFSKRSFKKFTCFITRRGIY